VVDLERRLVLVGWVRQRRDSQAMRPRPLVVCLRLLDGVRVRPMMRALGMRRLRLVRRSVEQGFYYSRACIAFHGALRDDRWYHEVAPSLGDIQGKRMQIGPIL